MEPTTREFEIAVTARYRVVLAVDATDDEDDGGFAALLRLRHEVGESCDWRIDCLEWAGRVLSATGEAHATHARLGIGGPPPGAPAAAHPPGPARGVGDP